jgi:outer membrane lipoprotein SlyB
MKHPVLLASFRRIPDADRAIENLLAAGYPEDSISVICPEYARPDVEHVHERIHQQDSDGDRAVPAAIAGGSIGAILGAVTAGIGIVATGGTGLLFAGPLFGAAAAGAISGTFISAMLKRGFESDLADYYDQELQQGRILVAVEEDDEHERAAAERAFRAAGAEPSSLPTS